MQRMVSVSSILYPVQILDFCSVETSIPTSSPSTHFHRQTQVEGSRRGQGRKGTKRTKKFLGHKIMEIFLSVAVQKSLRTPGLAN
jgi:hypothetical protein